MLTEGSAVGQSSSPCVCSIIFSLNFFSPALPISCTATSSLPFPAPSSPFSSYFPHFWPSLCPISRFSFQLSLPPSIVHSCFIFFFAFFPSLLPLLLPSLQTGSGVAAGAPDGGAAMQKALAALEQGSAPETTSPARWKSPSDQAPLSDRPLLSFPHPLALSLSHTH